MTSVALAIENFPATTTNQQIGWQRPSFGILSGTRPLVTMSSTLSDFQKRKTSSFYSNIVEMRIPLKRFALSLIDDMRELTNEEQIAYHNVLLKDFEEIGADFFDML
jgi:hypothetical protein